MTHFHLLLLNPPVFEAVLLGISLFAGFLGSILGLGGGAIIIPALTLFFGVNIRYAVGASVVAVIATSSGAAATYVKDHITNIRVAMLLEVATTVGALGGAILSGHISSNTLYYIFAAVLFYSGFVMLKKRHSEVLSVSEGDPLSVRLRLNSSYPDAQLGRDVAYAVKNVPLGFGLMIGAGVISGLLGIGSGALKVPAMDSAMHLPIKVSSATSNFMIGVTGAASAGTYFLKGDILPLLAAPVALGVLLGSLFGTRALIYLPADKVRKLFIVVLFFVCIQMCLKAMGYNFR